MNLIVGFVSIILGIFAVFGALVSGEFKGAGDMQTAKLGACISLFFMAMALALMATI